jgi:GT2 family glycosyltransferase
MVIVFHNGLRAQQVLLNNQVVTLTVKKKSIGDVLQYLSEKYNNEVLVWCHESLKEYLNTDIIPTIFKHGNLICSFHPGTEYPLSDAIGYVDQTSFIKVNRKVRFSTWRMSSWVGAIDSRVLIKLAHVLKPERDFEYFLNSLAKMAMPIGLFCYSEPSLLKNYEGSIITPKTSNYELFKFVKQHYKKVWVWLLFLDLLIYEKKIVILPLFFSLFYKKKIWPTVMFEEIWDDNLDLQKVTSSIDVIIPTIGRKKYLYDILNDLNQQTFFPQNVIIVEQNPNSDSVSELDYLTGQKWNFKIKHTFTHTAGACNARNIAIDQVESEWAFLADDDIRIDKDFLNQCMQEIASSSMNAYTIANKQPEEKLIGSNLKQFETFGSGCSLVNGNILKKAKFDLRFEYGYGEDADFGMKIRNLGYDVIYLPKPMAIHLKAPSGGFRVKHSFPWFNELVSPKPSPTIMLFYLLHREPKQLSGYQTISFFKFHKGSNDKIPLKYSRDFIQKWKKSIEWANYLIQNEPVR